MITTDKVTEMFCILDEFCKNLDADETFLSECLSQTGVALGLYVDALRATPVRDKDLLRKVPIA